LPRDYQKPVLWGKKIMEPEETQMKSVRDIWIYGDLRNQTLFDTSLNVLCGAADIAQSMSVKRVFVIVISENSASRCSTEMGNAKKGNECTDEMISKSSAVEQALLYGADRVLVIEPEPEDDDVLVVEPEQQSDCHTYLLPYVTARVVSAVVESRNPALFLFPLNDIMREISARCAFICHAGMVADCLRLKYEKSEIVAVCPSHGGELMAELGFSDASKTGFITVQPNAFKKSAVTCSSGSAEERVETLAVTIPSDSLEPLKLLCRKRDRAAELSLEVADKVVAGGAGMGNIEGFRNLRRLAAAMGAQIGATRPPVLWHWTDDDRLIGQTGKSIRPELLITVGTSGAVQYTAGITEAKTIVAVNRDPDAPIFRFADMGIVVDAAVFIPILTEKIQKITLRALADSLAGSDGVEKQADGEKGSDFGSRLMQIRQAHQFTHEDLAEKTGRTPEFIEELEKNLTTPSVGFMIKLSELFGIDPGTFLNDDERATLSGTRAKEYTRRTGNYYYQTLTPGAENEHLRVFMVTIEANKKHKPVSYRHEGEEFIYVMDGTLELILDGKVHKLMAGESLKYNSETPHQLKSLGSEDTRCLVTLYTP